MKLVKMKMNVILVAGLISLLMACNQQNQALAKEKRNADEKCKELLTELKVAENKLDSANKEILDLNAICTIGPACKIHYHLYEKLDSLERNHKKINARFQKELANSSKEFRKNYYSPILKELELENDSIHASISYLEQGTHGFEKCTEGSECPNPRHNALYVLGDSKQRELDSIRSILKNIR
ncbi:MAG: hypothetical protein ACK49D_10825 [Flavobacteriia bacterium]|jgi:hypothetical protein|nr:hypothetical protein [Cryomorphaceae bacterium]